MGQIRGSRRVRLIGVLLLLAVISIPWVKAIASNTESELTMMINSRGSVEVVDRWSNMVEETGVFNYFSAAKEVGIVPVTIRNHGFTINFTTRSYLRYEEGYYYFVTPDFYYEKSPLDVELTLTYPPNLVLKESRPLPSYIGEGVVSWSIQGAVHEMVLAKFEQVGPFVMPGRVGPDWQVDPDKLAILSAEEIPQSADDVLKELENFIVAARGSDSADEDMIRVLEKLKAKFYYIMVVNGLLMEFGSTGYENYPTIETKPEEPKEKPLSSLIQMGK